MQWLTNEQKLACYKHAFDNHKLENNTGVCVLIRNFLSDTFTLPRFGYTITQITIYQFPELEEWLQSVAAELQKQFPNTHISSVTLRINGVDEVLHALYKEYKICAKPYRKAERDSFKIRKKFINQQIKKLEALCKN